jgi:cyclic-di-AMP phosphodiesterase PgpH
MKPRKTSTRRKGRGGADDPVRASSWVAAHPVLLRVALALVTAAVLAALMVDWRPLSGARGLTVGDIAASDIRASRPVEVVDEQLTADRQQQAREAVPRVFEHDVLYGRGIQQRVEKAFVETREWLSTQQTPPTPGASSAPAGEPDEAATPAEPAPSTIDPVALQDRLDRFERTLGVEIEETDLATLQLEAFAEPIQRDLQELVRAAMNDYVVLSAEVLPEDGAVRVVRVEGSDTSETQLSDFKSVRDLGTARRFVAQEAATDFADRPTHVRNAIVNIAGSLLVPNLRFDASETEVRRSLAAVSVQPVITSYQEGQIIVRSGDEVGDWDLRVLQEMNAGASGYRPLLHHLATTLLLALFLVFTERFGVRFISKFRRRFTDLLTMALLTVLVALMSKLLHGLATALEDVVATVPEGAYAYVLPIAVGGIVVRILMNSETTVLWAIVTAIVCTDIMGGDPWLVVYYLGSAMAAAGGVGFASERGRLVRAGFIAALANVTLVVLLDLTAQSGIQPAGTMPTAVVTSTLYNVLFALGGGLVSGVLAVGLVPMFEALGFLTDSKLLELSSLNHPLIRDMIVKAPGTYHHSMVVGSLGEAAAESIHANSLLVRVGAYFHDIGKTRAPHYFVENQRGGDNPHDRLTPSMSSLVVTNHVKEGIELGRRHGLPEPIIGMIPQHHGTRRISFFYNKALEQTDPDKGTVEEGDYRYPGPKPQTKEAAIMMLADGAEAATRSLANHTEGAIRARVSKIVNGVVSDGQLDECPMTLRDLHLVSETFIQVLLGIHHQRIEYPAAAAAAAKAAKGSSSPSITLSLPQVTPSPDDVHPLERAAAEREGREPESIRTTAERRKDGSELHTSGERKKPAAQTSSGEHKKAKGDASGERKKASGGIHTTGELIKSQDRVVAPKEDEGGDE